MTKTLGRFALELAALAAAHFFPIPEENRPWLVSDLEKDPFVDHALNYFMCELYHKYGMFLAPFTAAVLKAKHCRFEGSQMMGIPQHGIGGRDDDTSSSREAHFPGRVTSVTGDNESNETEKS